MNILWWLLRIAGIGETDVATRSVVDPLEVEEEAMTNLDDGLPIVTGTLRERLTTMAHELGLSPDAYMEHVVDDIIEVVAGWLEDDDTRAVVYDGMVATGPMLGNVGKSLARAARGERVEGVEDDQSEEAVVG